MTDTRLAKNDKTKSNITGTKKRQTVDNKKRALEVKIPPIRKYQLSSFLMTIQQHHKRPQNCKPIIPFKRVKQICSSRYMQDFSRQTSL